MDLYLNGHTSSVVVKLWSGAMPLLDHHAVTMRFQRTRLQSLSSVGRLLSDAFQISFGPRPKKFGQGPWPCLVQGHALVAVIREQTAL